MRRQIKICENCNSTISLSNYSKHYLSKQCLSGSKQVKRSSLTCSYCNRKFDSAPGRGLHEVQCENNPLKRNIHIGKIAWNRGIKRTADTRNPEFIGRIGGYRPNAGRSKKFKVYDSQGNLTTLQSTYEYACFEILCELGIRWVRPKSLKYNGKNYFADFYLIDFDVWLDPKNDYKARCDSEKISEVLKQNKVKLFVLNRSQLTKEYISGII